MLLEPQREQEAGMISPESVWGDVEKIRENAPLVHNITNYVVMNSTANALLAIGASPVMAHAIEEVAEMTNIAGALVINIGTLSAPWIASMEKAMRTAKERGIPIVLDPVGAGATGFRTETTQRLIDAAGPSIIRGNASATGLFAKIQIWEDVELHLLKGQGLSKNTYHKKTTKKG